ncbi:hypothetical protein VPH35_072335 [Triticum aestivum]
MPWADGLFLPCPDAMKLLDLAVGREPSHLLAAASSGSGRLSSPAASSGSGPRGSRPLTPAPVCRRSGSAPPALLDLELRPRPSVAAPRRRHSWPEPEQEQQLISPKPLAVSPATSSSWKGFNQCSPRDEYMSI